VSVLVLLDAGPLGLATNPKGNDLSHRCKAWLSGLLTAGIRVMVPEVTDYEVRRELIRSKRLKSVARLDALAEQIGYLPIDTEVFRRAAELWADARNTGHPTAGDQALDCDMILSAQAQLAAVPGTTVRVATMNVGHLSHFVDARLWESMHRFHLLADDFAARVSAANVGPSTEVWLIYHCVDGGGRPVELFRETLVPAVKVDGPGTRGPGRREAAARFASSSLVDTILGNIESLVRHAPEGIIRIAAGPATPVQIRRMTLEIVQP
jgi:predicted nucleic acid-binding protein